MAVSLGTLRTPKVVPHLGWPLRLAPWGYKMLSPTWGGRFLWHCLISGRFRVDFVMLQAKKCSFFKHPKFDIVFRFFDMLMIISVDLDPKPYLRYCKFALTSIPSSNRGCDRFPSKFSKNWAPLQGILTFSRQVQFPSRENQFVEKSLGSLSQPKLDDEIKVSAKFQYRR